MIDANYHIRKGYFQRLNGSVIINSVAVPVYDGMAPNQAVCPYIILSTQTSVDRSAKRCQSQECTMLLDIVTEATGGVDRSQADAIVNQIYQLIYPVDAAGYIDAGPDLTVISTRLISDTTMEMQDDTFKILRRLIRFTHQVHEQVNI
ncbi:DUF3168 domain-containing protein [Chitinophaga pinensis]|uniref:Uncharacterized protein n=1 Tax=Chitinophaga pinensis (strain ATCC 43595 / DSM 2588 / LMG 13176 / NBRC 15968 / NCIMB 11800 / UQM 2034) TaxID=485918 RepID=A0A979G5P8_CHIPD|nr:hypothetical protein Cpin_3897 [Chitinophaga pinensis DSM 2588]